MAQKQASLQYPTNINERKDIDAAIIQLVAIVESSGDAVFGETLQGVITSWNSSAEKLFGYSADEVIGTSLSLMIRRDLEGAREIGSTKRRAGAAQATIGINGANL